MLDAAKQFLKQIETLNPSIDHSPFPLIDYFFI